jgi:integrase
MEAEIASKLQQKGLSDSSIKLYLKALKNLNDKKEIKNFRFLTKPEAIIDKLKDYKPTTQRNAIIGVVSILKALDNPLYNKYYDIMINMTKRINEASKTNEKTETQKENWMKWDEVVKVFDKMLDEVKPSRTITEQEYNHLLSTVVLGLYTLLPPRRNKDYTEMYITNAKDASKGDTNRNYLDMKKQQFIFNVYKTAKKDGQLIIAIPAQLQSLLKLYIKYHPLKAQMKNSEVPFLVGFDGKKIPENGITRILNKIFKKKVGSSMLRHIYLSSKYGDVLESQKSDSKLMSHNMATQKDYIKTDKTK